jgi:hypothetical protein
MVGLRRDQRHRQQHEDSGEWLRRSPVGSPARCCRSGGLVQAGRSRAGRAALSMSSFGRRPGRAPVWRRPSPSADPPPFLLLLLLCWCGGGRRGKQGVARFRGATGGLIVGARVWGAAAAGAPQRPGRDAWRHCGGAVRLGG